MNAESSEAGIDMALSNIIGFRIGVGTTRAVRSGCQYVTPPLGPCVQLKALRFHLFQVGAKMKTKDDLINCSL
jgi:hypothetical protein